MSLPTLTRQRDGELAVVGELNMQTVPALSLQANSILNGLHGDVTVDLSAVTRADSAGLALLVDWLRLARRHDYTLRFKNLPEQLRQIARVSELHEILPIQGG